MPKTERAKQKAAALLPGVVSPHLSHQAHRRLLVEKRGAVVEKRGPAHMAKAGTGKGNAFAPPPPTVISGARGESTRRSGRGS